MAFWNRNKPAMEKSERDVPRENNGIGQAGKVCNQGLSTIYQVLSIYLVLPAAFLSFRDQMASATSTSEKRVKLERGKALISANC